MGQKVIIRFR